MPPGPPHTAGRALLAGVMAPLITPMTRPGVPSAAAAAPLLRALAAAGVRALMLFGSNGEGPLLPTTARLADFATGVRAQWRELTGDGPVLVNITAAGTAEARARAETVLPARPDALVLSPPGYFHHRPDEILAHYAAFADLGTPLVAYNAPRYSNPLTPPLLHALAAMPHLAGAKDSSGDLSLLTHLIAAARRRRDFGVTQGAEHLALAALSLGADGIAPGIANLAPRLAVELTRAHREGREEDAAHAQHTIRALLELHTIRPGVPAVKAVLAARGLCPPHAAAPFTPCTTTETGRLLALLRPHDAHLVRP